MGKAVLIMILGSFFIFGIVNLTVNSSVTNATQNSIDYYAKNQARNISSSALRMALANLADNPDLRISTPVFKNLFGGTASYKIEKVTKNRQDVLKITATGEFLGQTQTSIAYAPISNSVNNQEVTPIFNFAIFSGKSIKIKDSKVLSDNPAWNANIHSNGSVHIDKKSVINGFVSYVKKFKGKNAEEVIKPNVNPAGEKTVFKTFKIEPPEFNPDKYEPIATDVYEKNLKINKDMTLGTPVNPKIIFVKGKLEVKKNVSFTGYGVFIVKKDIKLDGNVTINAVDPLGNNLGLYSKGKVKIKNGTTVYGQIYGEKGIKLEKNAVVHGSLATGYKGKVDLKKDAVLYYRPATSSITKVFKTIVNNRYGFGKSRYDVLQIYE